MSLSRFLNLNAPDQNQNAMTVFDDEGQQERPEYVPSTRITIPAYNAKTGSVGARSPKDFIDFDMKYVPTWAHEMLTEWGRGLIYVGEVDPVTKIWEGFEFAVLLVEPVTMFMDWVKAPDEKYAKQVGGLALWPTDENGARILDAKEPSCKSDDGRAPRARYVGPVSSENPAPHEVYDFRRKQSIRIGFDTKGNPLDPDFMCIKCPLGTFMRVGEKNLAPICKDNTTGIVYLPAQIDVKGRFMSGRLAVISGNPSVSMALRGRKAGASMGHNNPKVALLGLDEFIKPRTGEPTPIELQFGEGVNANGEPITIVTNVTSKQLPYIIGFSETADQLAMAEGRGYQAFPPRVVKSMEDFYEILTGLTTAKDAGGFGLNIKYVVFSFKVYDFAPQGLPDVVGFDAPVYPIPMALVDNNTKPNQQRVPMFQVLDPKSSPAKPKYLAAPLSAAQYAEYSAGIVRTVGRGDEGPISYLQLFEDSSVSNRNAVREKMALMGYGTPQANVIQGEEIEYVEPSTEAKALVAENMPKVPKRSTAKTPNQPDTIDMTSADNAD